MSECPLDRVDGEIGFSAVAHCERLSVSNNQERRRVTQPDKLSSL